MESLFKYVQLLGDQSMILGHRLSELCGHGPSLETDIALTNISLDLFGEVRSYFQYAAQLKADGSTEDDIAFLRYDREYLSPVLVEQPNTDFAHVIARQCLFDHYHTLLLEQLKLSKDETISAIAHKSEKEARYHLRFSSDWLKRLGDGTEESHRRAQAALDHLFPFVQELWTPVEVELEMHSEGFGADLEKIRSEMEPRLLQVVKESTLSIPEVPPRIARGKTGIHSEYMGAILSDLQYMQRAYPEMQW